MRLLWEHGELKPGELQDRFPEPIKNPELRSYLTTLARTADVRRRLDALSRKVFRSPLPRTFVMPALFVASLLLVLIGGFRFSRTEQARATPKASDATEPAAGQAAGKRTLRANAAESNEPIEGVSISSWSCYDGKYREATVTTGVDGTAVIEWVPNGQSPIMRSPPPPAPGFRGRRV